MLVAFINSGTLYVAQAASAASPLSAPAPLFTGAANPSISISNFGKAYLAFTATAGAGGGDVRAAYYYQGAVGARVRPRWTPTRRMPPASAPAGPTWPPPATASGSSPGARAGHIYTRRVIGTTPSTVVEQADPATFGGWSEASAGRPSIAAGGDSTYASVAFQEPLTNGSATQSRVLDEPPARLAVRRGLGGATAPPPAAPRAPTSPRPRSPSTAPDSSPPRPTRPTSCTPRRSVAQTSARPDRARRLPAQQRRPRRRPRQRRPDLHAHRLAADAGRRRSRRDPAALRRRRRRTSAPSRSSPRRRSGATDADGAWPPRAMWPAMPRRPGSRAAARAPRSSPPSSSRPREASCPPTASATSSPHPRCCGGRPRRSCGARPPTPCASTARQVGQTTATQMVAARAAGQRPPHLPAHRRQPRGRHHHLRQRRRCSSTPWRRAPPGSSAGRRSSTPRERLRVNYIDPPPAGLPRSAGLRGRHGVRELG